MALLKTRVNISPLVSERRFSRYGIGCALTAFWSVAISAALIVGNQDSNTDKCYSLENKSPLIN